MKYPLLYKRSSTGAMQHWQIEATHSMLDPDIGLIVTTWGQAGGAQRTTTDQISVGKNIGKKNETTPVRQAELEAKARWEKQLKKGYVKTFAEADAGEVDEIITGGVSPMLAHPFEKQGHKLKFPCLVQPKLDGHRCIAVVKGGKCTLWSRTRKPIVSMPHIVAAIEALHLIDGTVLDGELYNHELKSEFEQLTSFIRDSSVKPGSEVVQYHVYDNAGSDRDQFMRLGSLEGVWMDVPTNSPLILVETVQVEDEDELDEAFRGFLAKGYEGAIARNMAGKYVNKRSSDLLKIKEFQDAEFPVVGVEEGRGKLAGHAIFVCLASGNEFRAKMVGDTSELKKYWDDPSLAVGKQLTVKYFGTTKYGVPRFPVALRFRTDV